MLISWVELQGSNLFLEVRLKIVRNTSYWIWEGVNFFIPCLITVPLAPLDIGVLSFCLHPFTLLPYFLLDKKSKYIVRLLVPLLFQEL